MHRTPLLGRWAPLIIALGSCSLLCAALVSARIFYSGHITFIFLLWNVILAWVPFVASLLLFDCSRSPSSRTFVLLCIGGVWLLFYPNAPYILTDFLHLYEHPGVPLWYDLLLITSCAWTGLMLGFISLYIVQQVVCERRGAATAWSFVVLVSALSGFGIYLGRFARWNSWDVLVRPEAVLVDVWSRISDPLSHPGALGMPIGLGLFLFMAYLVIFVLLQIAKKPSGLSQKQ